MKPKDLVEVLEGAGYRVVEGAPAVQAALQAQLTVCGMCRRSISAEAITCRNCGALYSAELVEAKPVPSSSSSSSSEHWATQARMADGTFAPAGVRRLFDVEDVEVERMPTGDEAIDLVTGGGFARGCSYALHGPGGVGKSRVALRAAAKACAFGPVVYALATAEEHESDVRRHAKESGYFDDANVRNRLVVLDREDDPRVLIDRIRTIRPVFSVIDALSALEDEHYGAKILREIAHQGNSVVLSLFHETADGKMAGGSKLAYLVDAILDMDGVVRRGRRWKKLPTEEPAGFTRLRSRKNRHAPQATHAILELTTRGYTVVELGDGKAPEPEDDDDEKDERRDLVHRSRRSN